MPKLIEKRRNGDGSLVAVYDDGSRQELETAWGKVVVAHHRRAYERAAGVTRVAKRIQYSGVE